MGLARCFKLLSLLFSFYLSSISFNFIECKIIVTKVEGWVINQSCSSVEYAD